MLDHLITLGGRYHHHHHHSQHPLRLTYGETRHREGKQLAQGCPAWKSWEEELRGSQGEGLVASLTPYVHIMSQWPFCPFQESPERAREEFRDIIYEPAQDICWVTFSQRHALSGLRDLNYVTMIS